MRTTRQLISCGLYLFISLLLSPSLWAQGLIAGLDTSGIVYQMHHRTGALTSRSNEAFTSYSLGGTARRAGKFYYIAVPSGESENALFTVVLRTGAIQHIDLDRSEDARALFFVGRKLYGIFYDGGIGFAGLYRINLSTGVTSEVLDLSELNVEPLAGSFSSVGGFFYMLTKPESDASQRNLLRFKARHGSARLFPVIDRSSNPVLCNKLKPNAANGNFVCLASDLAETQVDVCRLSLRGRATCLNTIPNIERIGGGHTMLTQDQNVYYALGYAPGEPDNQHLIRFNSRGVVRADTAIDTIFIGAHFLTEEPVVSGAN